MPEFALQFAHIARLGRMSVEARRGRGLDASETHSEAHLLRVADLSLLIGDLYGFTSQEQLLCTAAAWFSDYIRSSTEDPNIGNLSMRVSYLFLSSANRITTTI